MYTSDSPRGTRRDGLDGGHGTGQRAPTHPSPAQNSDVGADPALRAGMWERHEDIAGSIEGFIRDRFDVRPSDATFGRTVSLWEQGYVDSIGVVEVIDFLESTFAVTIPEEALFSPGFTHIDGMARWVLELRGREPGANENHG